MKFKVVKFFGCGFYPNKSVEANLPPNFGWFKTSFHAM